MIYEFKKGELNKLNNLNQDLKTIFNNYIILDNGFIYGDSILRKGTHMVHTQFKMFFEYPDSYVIRINSKDLFETIKNNKKIITCIRIIDNIIYLGGEESLFKIGDMISFRWSQLSNELMEYMSLINLMVEDNKSNSTFTILSTEDTIDLVNNEYKNIRKNKYKTRITKEVIPGLKKSHEVVLDFFDHTKDKSLFYLGIKVRRAYCTSYHIYTCLHM